MSSSDTQMEPYLSVIKMIRENKLDFYIIKLESDWLQTLHPRSVSLGWIKRRLVTLQNLIVLIYLLDLPRIPVKERREITYKYRHLKVKQRDYKDSYMMS